MDPIFPHPGQTTPISRPAPVAVTMAPVSGIPALWQQDRISRLTALGPEDAAVALLWLAMNFPAVCDAMLDKVEYDAIDDPDPGREPEPFCAECGADIGIFLRFDLLTGGTIGATAASSARSSCSTPATLPSSPGA
jgi:hypothetical protein